MTATPKRSLDAYDVALWRGDSYDAMTWELIERIQIRTTSTSESKITLQAKFTLGLEGMCHKRRTEGERVVLELKDMFITIDTA